MSLSLSLSLALSLSLSLSLSLKCVCGLGWGSDGEDEWSDSDEETPHAPSSPPLGSPLCEWEVSLSHKNTHTHTRARARALSLSVSHCVWLEQEFKDDDGDVFYYNRVTEQSQVPHTYASHSFVPFPP